MATTDPLTAKPGLTRPTKAAFRWIWAPRPTDSSFDGDAAEVLRFGNGNAAKTGELLFSAGPYHESNGLLGKIVPVG